MARQLGKSGWDEEQVEPEDETSFTSSDDEEEQAEDEMEILIAEEELTMWEGEDDTEEKDDLEIWEAADLTAPVEDESVPGLGGSEEEEKRSGPGRRSGQDD
jgi:hypothetical protein